MELNLPVQCFISHSYKDADVRDRLVAKLPPDVPFIFPKTTFNPQDFVSNHLIEAILKCDGLIYLRGGESEKSFWVAFERDYALRAGKQVYSFDPVTLQIEPDTSDPLDLAVFASYARKDTQRVRKISEYLARERFFDIWLDWERVQVGEIWNEAITHGIKGSLNRAGYLITFWSEAAGKSKTVEEEIVLAINTTPKNRLGEDRVLFALLEDCPPPPEHFTDPHESPVQLYGDEKLSDAQRLDDLVVRLYWLIYRNKKNLE